MLIQKSRDAIDTMLRRTKPYMCRKEAQKSTEKITSPIILPLISQSLNFPRQNS
jgi:hypothetical protein